MKSIYAAIAGAGLMGLCCLPALAGPVSEADAAEAAEAIGVLAQETSDPFYDGSYYKVSVAESAPCTLTKRLVDFNKDGTQRKLTETTFDAALIDASTIQPDGLGGLKFWSKGEATVFHMKVVEGGNFEMDLPGDNWSVTDEAAETVPLIRALKVYVAWCEQEAGA